MTRVLGELNESLSIVQAILKYRGEMCKLKKNLKNVYQSPELLNYNGQRALHSLIY